MSGQPLQWVSDDNDDDDDDDDDDDEEEGIHGPRAGHRR